jgi:signal transduction histidine kinase
MVTDTVFYATVKWSSLWLGTAGLFAGACAFAVVLVLARGTLEPLREMANASEKIARGEFATRVSVESADEIGRLAESFNRMAGDLERTDRLRRDLVANVSHELRTPIAALQAKLENIADGVEAADAETIDVMLAQTQRLGRLVRQLLDLSRLEAGTVPLERRPFAVGPLLHSAVREAEMSRPDARIDVAVEPPDLVVDGDPERIHQVVANLVENAVRYSPAGAPVAVEAARTADGVRIAVADEGPGIPESETERVFERFYRSDRARSSTDGGAGLGLAIVQWIVDLHGGEIHPESRRPHGCRMVVTLPSKAA